MKLFHISRMLFIYTDVVVASRKVTEKEVYDVIKKRLRMAAYLKGGSKERKSGSFFAKNGAPELSDIDDNSD